MLSAFPAPDQGPVAGDRRRLPQWPVDPGGRRYLWAAFGQHALCRRAQTSTIGTAICWRLMTGQVKTENGRAAPGFFGPNASNAVPDVRIGSQRAACFAPCPAGIGQSVDQTDVNGGFLSKSELKLSYCY